MSEDEEEQETPYSFGEYIRALRLKQGLTLDKAAKALGYSRGAYLCDIESGRRKRKDITLEFLRNCSRLYKVALADLIKNTESAVRHDKTVSEILSELVPAADLAEKLSTRMVEVSATYSVELEVLAGQVHKEVQSVFALAKILQKRHLTGPKRKQIIVVD